MTPQTQTSLCVALSVAWKSRKSRWNGAFWQFTRLFQIFSEPEYPQIRVSNSDLLYRVHLNYILVTKKYGNNQGKYEKRRRIRFLYRDQLILREWVTRFMFIWKFSAAMHTVPPASQRKWEPATNVSVSCATLFSCLSGAGSALLEC